MSLISEVKGVDSFDEFMEKFAPVVYSFYNAVDQSVSYSLKKPEGIDSASSTEISLG